MEGIVLPENFTALIALAVFVALMNERLVEVFIAKWFEHYKLDGFWLVPISWVTGGLIMAGTATNLFSWLFPSEIIGRIMTAIVVGGGSNMLHMVFSGVSALKDIAKRLKTPS
jgi:hypothetical protein